jgi:hypothetical protein
MVDAGENRDGGMLLLFRPGDLIQNDLFNPINTENGRIDAAFYRPRRSAMEK